MHSNIPDIYLSDKILGWVGGEVGGSFLVGGDHLSPLGQIPDSVAVHLWPRSPEGAPTLCWFSAELMNYPSTMGADTCLWFPHTPRTQEKSSLLIQSSFHQKNKEVSNRSLFAQLKSTLKAFSRYQEMVQKRQKPFKFSHPRFSATMYLPTFGQIRDEGHTGKIYQGDFATEYLLSVWMIL